MSFKLRANEQGKNQALAQQPSLKELFSSDKYFDYMNDRIILHLFECHLQRLFIKDRTKTGANVLVSLFIEEFIKVAGVEFQRHIRMKHSDSNNTIVMKDLAKCIRNILEITVDQGLSLEHHK